VKLEVIPKGRTIVQKVVDQILTHLATGSLKAGDILPVESRLAEIFKIGKSTIREALRVLETKGIVEIKPRKGVVIRSIPDGLSAQGGVELKLKINRRYLADLLDFLLITLVGAIKLTCRNRTVEDLKRLKHILGKIEGSVAAIARGGTGRKIYQTYGDHYRAFFFQLGKATQNGVYMEEMRAILVALGEHLPLGEIFFTQELQEVRRLLSYDRELIEAIEKRKLDRAADLAEKRAHEIHRILDRSLGLYVGKNYRNHPGSFFQEN
jgi:DNA-binding FadR family transcriptional regulator